MHMTKRLYYSIWTALLTFLSLSLSPYGLAQSAYSHEYSRLGGVPQVVKFRGIVKDADGQLPSGVRGVRFAVYAEAIGGPPLWEEIQNVQFVNGHYTVLLGATLTEGIPANLFSSDKSRWLGVSLLAPGEQEQPRVFLTSVPYAFKAADADTLGGLPASAYVRVDQDLPKTLALPSNSLATTLVGTEDVISPTSPLRGATPREMDIRDPGGVANLQKLEAVKIFNVLLVDGMKYRTLAQALAGCPIEGCTIDMRGNSNPSALVLGTFDPGKRAVTLLLGPYRYTATQITLRTNLQIIGYGSGTVAGGQGTIIASDDSRNRPLFVLPQANHNPAQFVVLRNFEILAAAQNTSQDCFFLDTSGFYDSGLRYSVFDQLQITGFRGVSLHLRGSSNTYNGLNEWDQFNSLIIYRPSGGGNAVRIEGANGQIEFIGGQYDGQIQGEGTNIYVGTYLGGSVGPLDITFHKVTTQLADVGVNVNGCRMCDFAMHHEAINGVYLINHSGTDASGDMVIIENTQFDNGCGINGGSGYLVNVTTTQANIVFRHNIIGGVPDHVIEGTNGMAFSAVDNMFNTLPSNVYTSSGVAYQVNPEATIGIGRSHLVRLNASATCIATLQSALGPGELVTFRALGDTCFNSGGNMEFGNYSLPLNLTLGQTATFIRNDSDINFTLIGTSIAPETSRKPVAVAHFLESSGAPTISSGFGASAAIVGTGTAAFMVKVGTKPAASGTIVLPRATNGWNCFAFDVTSPMLGGGYSVKQTADSTTSVTLAGYDASGSPRNWAANDMLRVSCLAF